MVAGSLKYDTKLDSDGFKKGLSKLGSVASTAAKGIAAGMAAATAAVTGLVTASVKAYAEYEQLVGGVDKLYQESSQKVQEYAANAFKTAGISANQYMETVTGISANLIKSLGGDTEKAADMANMAISDMADNANTFGTSMEDVQNVYSALARGMYVTLDNLKLGYAGTKEGAQQMIDDANRIKEANGEMADLSVDNYADIVEAIHIAQEQLHITGTTAKEASTTIQGSLNQVKASWNNLVTGMSNKNADISKLIDDFVESVATFGKNLLPVIEQALLGIGKLIEELLPEIMNRIPTILNEILPQLLNSGVNMLNSILSGIQQNLPTIVEGIITVANTLVQTFLTMLPQLINVGIQIIMALILGIAQQLPELIPQIVDCILLMVDTIIDNLDLIIEAGVQLIIGLAIGLINAIPKLLEKLPTIIGKLVAALTKPEMIMKLILAGIQLILALAKGLIQAIPQLIMMVPKVISSIKDELVNNIKNTDWGKLGKDMLKGILNGLINFGTFVKDTVVKLKDKIVGSIKSIFGIHSPSRLMRDEIGKNLVLGVGVSFEKDTSLINDQIEGFGEDVVDKMQKAVNVETGKMSLSGINGTVNEMLSANAQFTGDINNVLTLDGETIYENQQKITARKNLQYGGVR